MSGVVLHARSPRAHDRRSIRPVHDGPRANSFDDPLESASIEPVEVARLSLG
jgi:hypothetical protein